ncbi:MAG: UDP-N-acetylmuramoyl-L-alanine--D-glutamate ligase, partial [Alphaproteobacteria bacterium]|nr:UDP-N-acetylmuramoyl-L-alanine--D-glutamate ligase [Alphaproteobacteria bacterium]
KISALVLSPGVPLTHPAPHRMVQYARSAGVEVIGDLELFERTRFEQAKGSHLIAVTGTNGKSTSVALITHLLHHAGFLVEQGGNIGTPILDLKLLSNETVYVVEYSSYQLDLTPSLHPHVGVFLNLSDDHLDRHGTMENYAGSKAHLINATINHGGTAIIGVDDPFLLQIADRLERTYQGASVIRISVSCRLEQGIFAEDGFICKLESGRCIPLVDLRGLLSLCGVHNWQNAISAFCVCRVLGIPLDVIIQGMSCFSGLPHRMEPVGRWERVLFVNDSKGTNVTAVAQALAAFNPIYWIVGGRAKNGGICSLEEFFPRIAQAFLIGEAASEFSKTLEGKVPFTLSGNLGAAVAAAAIAASGSVAEEPVVLFSPACSSFDQFRNFEARGDAFRTLVADFISQEKERKQASPC